MPFDLRVKPDGSITQTFVDSLPVQNNPVSLVIAPKKRVFKIARLADMPVAPAPAPAPAPVKTRVFKVARAAEEPTAAAPPASPKTGSLEYFEKQKEKFKGTKYEKFVEEEIRAKRDDEIDKLDKKMIESEFLQNLKDPVKIVKLIDIINQSRLDFEKREQEITAMMTKIPAPTGTKAQIIELIEEMVRDPVDRSKLRLDYRDKGTLQTIYMNTKARYAWYKKNKPGQDIDFDLD